MTDSILVIKGGGYHELPVSGAFFLDERFLPANEAGRYPCVLAENRLLVDGRPLSLYKEEAVNGATLLWFRENTKVFPFPENGRIRVGTDEACDVILSCAEALDCVFERGLLHLDVGTTYLNGRKITSGRYASEPGDCVLAGGFKITAGTDRISLSGDESSYKTRLYDIGPVESPFDGFPYYKRSPRIIKRMPDDTVGLVNPPAQAEKKKGQLLKLILPPLIMLGMTIAATILMPRGIYALIGIATTLTSTVMTTTNYLNEKRDAKKAEIARQENYEEYMLSQREKLFSLRAKQREAAVYHYPPVERIAEMSERYSNRIWERGPNDDDFLTVSVGYSPQPGSYRISRGGDDVSANKDPMLEELKEIVSEFSMVEELPTVVDLKRAHLGLVGEARYVHEQLMVLLAQLCFFQSYHDVEIVCLFEDKHRERFEWLRWLPHCRVRAINVTGLVDGENIRDQVLGNLAQELKSRALKQDEQKKETLYLPHYIFVIDDPKLAINHSIMEYLQRKDATLGFSLIWTTNMMASLPDNIRSVLALGDSKGGTLTLNEGRLVNHTVQFERTDSTGLEHMSRSLAALTHVQGVSTRIPESITFFDLYGVKNPEEIGVEARWASGSSHKSLAVPLGVRGKDDVVELNLHEKAHGPHGLVAGTTGSGKSEIIQSYILSLAVNFHPYEVGFLLIDYKGGGMAGLFKNLPHLLGMITNLDGGESMRAMASIKSELSRRQQVFSEHGVNHINQYNKLFRAGEAKQPLPHLFLISDEFAELKKEKPEFMSELVSAARIGRSLGIHLILATQKPTGVVDDQIWSNSKFKLALKVQDASDSNEVLKTPDAANITQPGRAYLQVGNNEIYELFQSAWSGAPYSHGQEKADYDDRVYLINRLGQRQLLGTDLSGGEAEESRITQLDAVVEHMREVFAAMNLAPVERPWHPPLPGKMVSPHIGKIVDTASFTELDARVPLGLVDIPELQKQEEFVYDFTQDGNLAVFGSSGFGKSTTMMTILLTLAVKNSPLLLQYFILDLGNAALAQMRGLPHTADYMSLDETDKLEKLVKLLSEEMQRRKALLAEKNALNFTMYNMTSGDKLAAIVVAVDNYDVVREMGYDLEDFWTRLTRDGAGIGIYVVATATRSNAFKYVVLNNFKKKLAHVLTDQNDMTAIIGRTPYSPGEIPGRAFLKFANVNMMQVYSAVPYEDTVSYARMVGALVDELREGYSGAKTEGIRMLPDVLDYGLLLEYEGGARPGLAPVGLDYEEVTVQHLPVQSGVSLVMGTAGSGKTNVLRLVLRSLDSAQRVLLVDSREMELGDFDEVPHIRYCADASGVTGMLEELRELVRERREAFAAQSGIPPRQFYASLPTICVVADDADNFIELIKASGVAGAEALVKESLTAGIGYVVSSASSRLKGFDEISKTFKESTNGVILGLPIAQTVWQIPGTGGYKPKADSAILYRKGDVTPIKIPLLERAVTARVEVMV